ncbi:hypothetical protein [Pseudomonas viridiflava]|uniref:hypothetical protein n=1 Tax=Pseudomonas viridiflava TaxID=33069 RepID=UPI0013C3244B|nr:hypothetical protein [Pseudomonas viridiflava]
MIDLVKFSLPLLLSRNKNLQYKKNIMDMSVSLLRFLESENLISIGPFTDSGELKSDFELRESQFTEEGLEFFKRAVPKWWNKIDRGLDRSDVTYLESELLKIRAAKLD